MKLKPIVTIICLTVGGISAMVLGENTIAATCFGAIAAWGFINGAREAIKNKGEG